MMRINNGEEAAAFLIKFTIHLFADKDAVGVVFVLVFVPFRGGFWWYRWCT